MYGHGFATLFLAEAYGMSMRPDIREKLSKAVELDHQHAEQRRAAGAISRSGSEPTSR